MKIIYHCYGGAHSSVTAANIHLGLLPADRFPGYDEIKGQKFFDLHGASDIGKIYFMGRDSFGNNIYILGRRSRPTLVYSVTRVIEDAFEIDPGSYMLVDVSPHVNLAMKIGGFLSRKMNLTYIGRPIVTWGTVRTYDGILKLVEMIKSQTNPDNSSNKSYSGDK
ncbi:MAG: DUF3189 family protein [Bacillota bacterium]